MLNEPPRLSAWVLVAVQLPTQVFSSISGDGMQGCIDTPEKQDIHLSMPMN
jgi:hypothetical protein